MRVNYCECDIQIQSVVKISEGITNKLVSDEHDSAWETLCSFYHGPQGKETSSIPETPHFDPAKGDPSTDDPAIGVATKIESKERMTQTPLISRLIQGYLEHTGIDACPLHQMDHGVRDPDGLQTHSIITRLRAIDTYRYLPSTCQARTHTGLMLPQCLLVCVWSLGHMRAFGVESRPDKHRQCCRVYSPPLRISER